MALHVCIFFIVLGSKLPDHTVQDGQVTVPTDNEGVCQQGFTQQCC